LKGKTPRNKGHVTTMALPFTLKSILRQKTNYRNLGHISPCKNIVFKKTSSKRNQGRTRAGDRQESNFS
jgi:hypothetical protein